uniref:Knottins-like domain-containing protein n=1 Tax=Lactuca sativa TaxID=4236 RepID=A0A9R1W4F0_LACSA|nr:hypothetical protein LSAT_V11C300112100 [Lactuca sativa]
MIYPNLVQLGWSDLIQKQQSSNTMLVNYVYLLNMAEMSSSMGVETKSCRYSSKTYKGLCFYSRNCDIICKAEGAPGGGHCQILTLRCFCNVCDPD